MTPQSLLYMPAELLQQRALPALHAGQPSRRPALTGLWLAARAAWAAGLKRAR